MDADIKIAPLRNGCYKNYVKLYTVFKILSHLTSNFYLLLTVLLFFSTPIWHTILTVLIERRVLTKICF